MHGGGNGRFDPGRSAVFSLIAAAHLSIACGGGGEIESTSQDYTQWRGLRSDGSASAFVEPARWPDELSLEWRVDIGTGYATPLVVGGVVYAFVRREDEEVLLALDASTGDELWQSADPAPFEPGEAAAAHGAGPKATPVYRDGRSFTLASAGSLPRSTPRAENCSGGPKHPSIGHISGRLRRRSPTRASS